MAVQLPLPLKVLTKIASFACAGLIIGLAIWTILQSTGGFLTAMNKYIMVGNTIILAMVLALSELEWKTMEENFYLTANLFGRGLYLLLVGTLFIASSAAFPLATGIICMSVGVIYMILYCVVPEAKAGPAPPADLSVTIA